MGLWVVSRKGEEGLHCVLLWLVPRSLFKEYPSKTSHVKVSTANRHMRLRFSIKPVTAKSGATISASTHLARKSHLPSFLELISSPMV
jgi:hypothetical protein